MMDMVARREGYKIKHKYYRIQPGRHTEHSLQGHSKSLNYKDRKIDCYVDR